MSQSSIKTTTWASLSTFAALVHPAHPWWILFHYWSDEGHHYALRDVDTTYSGYVDASFSNHIFDYSCNSVSITAIPSVNDTSFSFYILERSEEKQVLQDALHMKSWTKTITWACPDHSKILHTCHTVQVPTIYEPATSANRVRD